MVVAMVTPRQIRAARVLLNEQVGVFVFRILDRDVGRARRCHAGNAVGYAEDRVGDVRLFVEMHDAPSVALRQIGNRGLFPQRLQRNLRLQARVNLPSRSLCHAPLRLLRRNGFDSNYSTGPKSRVHFTMAMVTATSRRGQAQIRLQYTGRDGQALLLGEP